MQDTVQTMKKARDVQVSGDHYKKMTIQPFDYCQSNHLDAMEFSVVKYVSRHQSKGGREDLEKAKHCLDLLLEHAYPLEPAPDIQREEALSAYHEMRMKEAEHHYYELQEKYAELEKQFLDVSDKYIFLRTDHTASVTEVSAQMQGYQD